MNGDTYPPGDSGWVEVICGVMFSGKSEELIRRVRRALIARKRVQVFKSHLDERYAGLYHVSSHDGRTAEAVPVDSPDQIARAIDPLTQVVAIDEAQFFDAGIVDVCDRLAGRGLRVIVAGLDQDYLGRPFSPMPELMAIAEDVTKVHAVCTACGGTASRSQRLIRESVTVLVGGAESYEARCRACFEPRELARAAPLPES